MNNGGSETEDSKLYKGLEMKEIDTTALVTRDLKRDIDSLVAIAYEDNIPFEEVRKLYDSVGNSLNYKQLKNYFAEIIAISEITGEHSAITRRFGEAVILSILKYEDIQLKVLFGSSLTFLTKKIGESANKGTQ